MVCAQWERAPGRRRTVGADKAYDGGEFVNMCGSSTPHRT